MTISSTNGLLATARGRGRVETIDTALLGELPIGTQVLVFLGSAHSLLTELEAQQINKALDALEAIQSGGEVGEAFADLDARGPQLPPHLQIKLNAQTEK